jgi:hypothetical protein
VPKPQESTAAEYRAEAEQVRRQAWAATDQTVQRQLLAIAATTIWQKPSRQSCGSAVISRPHSLVIVIRQGQIQAVNSWFGSHFVARQSAEPPSEKCQRLIRHSAWNVGQ